MVGNYKVITLCGSTRFKEEFINIQKRLTLEGNIVISVGLFGHAGDSEVWENMDEGTLTKTKEMLDDMHKRKIDMADSIFVINKDGYIGTSTRSEIEYAIDHGKEVEYLEPPISSGQQVMAGMEHLIPEESAVLDLLEKNSAHYVDKTSSGGNLWIIGGHELDEVVAKCRTLGVFFHYKETGGKATDHKPAWWATGHITSSYSE